MRVSLLRIAAGFLIATIFGIVLGTLIYQNKVIEQTIMPLVDAVRPLSALALFPLIILLFGIGEASKVFVIFFTAWPPILINTLHGLREVDKATIEAAKVDGASKWHTLINITMPLALPTIVTGLKIGLSTGWISLVAAEMLGAQSGLGYSIVFYANSFQYPDMFAVILTVALLGLAINSLATNIQRLAYFEKENE
jgi:ABC-type nitrate/sulfonate/bicarbonate transport system permease component